MASIKRALPQRRLFKRTVAGVFDTLDWLEERLARQPYLVSDELTEADIRLFTTLVRFDPVYYGHFKCNRRALVDYPALWDYTRALYQHPDIRPTVNFDHIKGHYYGSHPWLNPSGIVPIGPQRDFDMPVAECRRYRTAQSSQVPGDLGPLKVSIVGDPPAARRGAI